MEKIVCVKHELEFSIPTANKEFLLDRIHDNLIQLQLHHKQFPNCKFEKASEKT